MWNVFDLSCSALSHPTSSASYCWQGLSMRLWFCADRFWNEHVPLTVEGGTHFQVSVHGMVSHGFSIQMALATENERSWPCGRESTACVWPRFILWMSKQGFQSDHYTTLALHKNFSLSKACLPRDAGTCRKPNLSILVSLIWSWCPCLLLPCSRVKHGLLTPTLTRIFLNEKGGVAAHSPFNCSAAFPTFPVHHSPPIG